MVGTMTAPSRARAVAARGDQTMSRGHGKWERAILQVLERVPAFYLTDLLPNPHTRSHVVALNRAARCLIAVGKAQAMHWHTRGGAGYGYITTSIARTIRSRPIESRSRASIVASMTRRHSCNI